MRSARLLALGLIAAGALFAAPAHAGVRLGLGADYWLGYGGEFNLTLGINSRLSKHLSLGGRFGALITTNAVIGVPLDFDLRAHLTEGIYLEGLVGPWLTFDGGFPVRGHAAIGFGIAAGPVQFGLEVGYLSSGAVIGLRIGLPL